MRGKRAIGHKVNVRLWTPLYRATLSATRYNQVIATYDERLRDAGKPMWVARCAAARKLLHTDWAVGTSTGSVDPEYRNKQPQCAAA